MAHGMATMFSTSKERDAMSATVMEIILSTAIPEKYTTMRTVTTVGLDGIGYRSGFVCGA